jgi:hypothetical protein
MRVAIAVGGAASVWDEMKRALDLAPHAEAYVCNDMIPVYPGPCTAVTLHPHQLKEWLSRRNANGLPRPKEVWSHASGRLVTRRTLESRGSSGLLCVHVARLEGFERIMLCGIPMTKEGGHFVRNAQWDAAETFQKHWPKEFLRLAPYVRSFSGWTKETFGEPTPTWLTGQAS